MGGSPRWDNGVGFYSSPSSPWGLWRRLPLLQRQALCLTSLPSPLCLQGWQGPQFPFSLAVQAPGVAGLMFPWAAGVALCPVQGGQNGQLHLRAWPLVPLSGLNPAIEELSLLWLCGWRATPDGAKNSSQFVWDFPAAALRGVVWEPPLSWGHPGPGWGTHCASPLDPLPGRLFHRRKEPPVFVKPL